MNGEGGPSGEILVMVFGRLGLECNMECRRSHLMLRKHLALHVIRWTCLQSEASLISRQKQCKQMLCICSFWTSQPAKRLTGMMITMLSRKVIITHFKGEINNYKKQCRNRYMKHSYKLLSVLLSVARWEHSFVAACAEWHWTWQWCWHVINQIYMHGNHLGSLP